MMGDRNCSVDPIRKVASAEELSASERRWLDVEGMGCPNCAHRVGNSLLGIEGVSAAQVDHRQGEAVVDFNPAMVTLDDLVTAVSAAGGDGRHEYSVTPAA